MFNYNFLYNLSASFILEIFDNSSSKIVLLLKTIIEAISLIDNWILEFIVIEGSVFTG